MHHHTRTFLRVFICTAILVVHPLAGADSDSHDVSSAKVLEKPILAKSSTRNFLGQLFIFGIPGKKLDDHTRAHLKETRPGAFILFKRNLFSNKQVADLTNDLQAFARAELGGNTLIGLDQEGGRVTRIPFSPALPSALALGRTKDSELVEEMGFQVGRALRQLGFSMNFAPVLDLGNERRYSFLGQRAFAEDPEAVARMGSAYGRGLLRSKVLPIAKHFPGIGPIPNDPHLSLVRRNVSAAEMDTKDLVPFKQFIPVQPSGIMISHLIYPKLDDSGAPGTYSSKIVNSLLRERLSYRGLIVTDDLMMEGAQGGIKSFEENIVRAFEAGSDLLMISWSSNRQKLAVAALQKALDSGRIKENDVLERLARIRAVKEQLKPSAPARALDDKQLLVYGFKDYEQLLSKILAQSVSSSTKPEAISRLLVLRDQVPYLSGMRIMPDKVRSGSMDQILNLLKQKSRSSASMELKSTSLLFVIKTRSDDELAAQIPQDLRDQVLLVNLWRPDRKSGAFPKSFELFVSHPERDKQVGIWLNQWLSEPMPIDQAPPSSEPLRIGPVPNPYRLKIQSRADFPASATDPGLL